VYEEHAAALQVSGFQVAKYLPISDQARVKLYTQAGEGNKMEHGFSDSLVQADAKEPKEKRTFCRVRQWWVLGSGTLRLKGKTRLICKHLLL
jgi:hypothetical protein